MVERNVSSIKNNTIQSKTAQDVFVRMSVSGATDGQKLCYSIIINMVFFLYSDCIQIVFL